MKPRAEPTFGGFHAHLGPGISCSEPRAEVTAEEHEYLVREAARLGCRWLASLRHSHPMLISACCGFPAPSVIEEIERLLGDPTVDDRARWAAKRLRALRDAVGAKGTALTVCGVGSEPYEEPRWR